LSNESSRNELNICDIKYKQETILHVNERIDKYNTFEEQMIKKYNKNYKYCTETTIKTSLKMFYFYYVKNNEIKYENFVISAENNIIDTIKNLQIIGFTLLMKKLNIKIDQHELEEYTNIKNLKYEELIEIFDNDKMNINVKNCNDIIKKISDDVLEKYKIYSNHIFFNKKIPALNYKINAKKLDEFKKEIRILKYKYFISELTCDLFDKKIHETVTNMITYIEKSFSRKS
jgi:hypothetical protein